MMLQRYRVVLQREERRRYRVINPKCANPSEEGVFIRSCSPGPARGKLRLTQSLPFPGYRFYVRCETPSCCLDIVWRTTLSTSTPATV